MYHTMALLQTFASVLDGLVECKSIPTGKVLEVMLKSSLEKIFPELKIITYNTNKQIETLVFNRAKKLFAIVEIQKDIKLRDREKAYRDELDKKPHQSEILAKCKQQCGAETPTRWPGAYIFSLTDDNLDPAYIDQFSFPVVFGKLAIYEFVLKTEIIEYIANKDPIGLPKQVKRPGRPPKDTVGHCITIKKFGKEINDLAKQVEQKLNKLDLQIKSANNKYSRVSFMYNNRGVICTLSATKKELRIDFSEPKDRIVIKDDDSINLTITKIKEIIEKKPEPPEKNIAYRSTSHPSLTIPMCEKPNVEFKASFQFNYKADEFEKINNKEAAQKEREKVNKEYYGRGLKYAVAKAVVGFANSYHKEGYVWIGVGDADGNNKPKLLGLAKDRLHKLNQDARRRKVHDMLKDCIIDYTILEPNLEISFPEFGNRMLCLIKIKKQDKPTYLIASNKFWSRALNAPQTEQIPLDQLDKFKAKRFP